MTKKGLTTPVKLVLSSLLVLFLTVRLNAQKLPNVQVESVRVPANIKIDGKLSEWNDKLQAYNHADEIQYTLSNDDNNLYLAVLAPYPDAPFKIMHNDLAFTISHDKRNREKAADNVTIGFPLLKSRASNITISTQEYEKFRKDTTANKKQIDSLVEVVNTKADKTFKNIQVLGINGIDSMISVYNTEGIKVAGQFNRKMDFIFELAIPLKYLDLSVNDRPTFSYNILLKGFPVPAVRPVDGFGRPMAYVTDNPPSPRMRPTMIYLNYPTDFWGEYTLAKK